MAPKARDVGWTIGRLIVLVALGALLLGCAFGATRNVRAFRAYADEPSNAAVALDRAEDLVEALRLLDEALAGTVYKPGIPGCRSSRSPTRRPRS